MGLLDSLSDFASSDQGLGLAQGLLSARGSQGLSAGLAGMQRAKQLEQEMAMKKQFQAMQMEEMQAQAMQRKALAQREQEMLLAAQRKQAALPSLFGQGAGSGPTDQVNAALPSDLRIGAQPALPGAGGLDWKRGLAAGYTPKELQDMAGLRNINQEKVARTIDGKDAQGRPVTYQLDEFGRPVGGSPIEQWKAPIFEGLGDRKTAIDPVTLKQLANFRINQSPDSVASNAISIRGQNMADARSRESNAIQQNAQRTQLFQTPEGILAVDKGTGQANPVMIGGKPVRGEDAMKKSAGANNVLALLDQAEKLLPGATGSIAGTGLDYLASGVGISTSGAQKTAQLKTIEGALIGSMPRMEGPQSDADRMLYQKAAGDIANPMAPVKTRQAATKTIREIQNRYASPQVGGGGTDIDALLQKYAK